MKFFLFEESGKCIRSMSLFQPLCVPLVLILEALGFGLDWNVVHRRRECRGRFGRVGLPVLGHFPSIVGHKLG